MPKKYDTVENKIEPSSPEEEENENLADNKGSNKKLDLFFIVL